jgi:glycosyltransferase involved in cell wall biosynthesis
VKVLYLYEEVMGYTIATLRELAKRGAEINVVHWDHKKLTPFRFHDIGGVKFHSRSTLSVRDVIRLAETLSPDITVVSGWTDRAYLLTALNLRRKSKRVVLALDGPWRGTIKQRLAAVLGALGVFRFLYSHAWVAGVYQYQYAVNLGLRRDEIVFDLYSADLTLFHNARTDSSIAASAKFPRTFLFVGRLEKIKGLETLSEAWRLLGNHRGDWTLRVIGNGSLQGMFDGVEGVVTNGFLQPEYLAQEVAGAGCFVLPSSLEPWGVVVHEFVASGLPLILSSEVGSANVFLIPGENGFVFNSGDAQDLADCMRAIIDSPECRLREMGAASHRLSFRVTPASSAANLLSVASRLRS